MPRKKIPDTTQRIIYLRSGNMCCYPDCKTFIYNKITKTYYGQICHIRAVSPNGPRYDASLSEQEIHSEQNLILMCANHHIEIDSDIKKFTVELLTDYKSSHEGKLERLATDSETRSQIDIDRIAELTKTIDEMLKSQSNETNELILLPKKKGYSKVTNYIERNLTSTLNGEDGLIESLPILGIIKKHNKITVLGVAGTGKSIELKFLANHYSEIDSEFYPVMVRLNLLSNTSLESYLKVEYPDFDKIPHENLLIILDALDEVHSDYLDKVANDIALLAKTYEKSKFVVSCRNNLYVTETSKYNAKIEGFKTYSLNPLGETDVTNYISTRVSNSDDFVNKLKRFGLFELMESPFYLVNLAKYYEKHKDIPKSKKDVFEFLIKERIEEDSAKYIASGLKIKTFRKQIEAKIEELAITAQCLGRNYLHEHEEFQVIVNDTKLLELINHTFLISKDKADKWMFDHNNFQEYLSAKRLAKFDLSKIKNIASFPGNRKIKPYWVNTLSFLFSILDNQSKKFTEIFNWITEIEEDILIRFEKDKLDLNTREEIFKRIYTNYENKGIRIGNEKFSIDDLAKFVSDSDAILLYLIDKAKTGTDYITLTEKTSIFIYFDNAKNYKSQISDLLVSKILDSDIKNEPKYYCMCELAIHNIASDKITESIIKSNNFNSQYIRAGFYNYIINADNIEKYIDIYIEGIKYCISSSRRVAKMRDPNEDIDYEQESEEMELYDEKYSLEKVFKKIKLK